MFPSYLSCGILFSEWDLCSRSHIVFGGDQRITTLIFSADGQQHCRAIFINNECGPPNSTKKKFSTVCQLQKCHWDCSYSLLNGTTDIGTIIYQFIGDLLGASLALFFLQPWHVGIKSEKDVIITELIPFCVLSYFTVSNCM